MGDTNHLAEEEQQWSLESLNKAYQKGYMAGLTSHSLNQQPYTADVLQAAWEAGWSDGQEQALLQPQSRSA
ncbi:ribosome modulation factor [Pseudomonas pohangensis]|uniref:Ribosome modulation factor n=1 Tax=Pseudomonas pohangensis TaxID=364197 RepID=A0A1H2HMV7_9PSED|nr:ribosome modulation factor [Pseudomonas pohangensis]SDU33132.1 ribosome modulation factor [Pseudomonas pohangensis]